VTGPLTTAIVVVKTIVLLLGGAVTFIAVKAARRNGSTPLRYLALGFGVITLGVLSAGIANLVFGEPLQLDVLINGVLAAVGLGVIFYSLYLQE